MDNNIVDNFLHKGLELFQKNKFSDAKYYFEKVLRIEPNNIKANHALGVLYGTNSEHEKAREFFKQALKYKSDFSPSLYNLAISLIELGELSESELILQKLIVANPQDYNFYEKYIICLMKQNKFDEAEKFNEKLINLYPSNPDSHKKMGLIKIHQNKYLDSIPFFLKAQELGKDETIKYYLGETFYNLEDYDKAISFFNEYLAESKNKKLIFNTKERLARSHDQKKDYQKSIQLFKELENEDLSTKDKVRILASLSNVYIHMNEKDFDADYSMGQYYAQEVLKIDQNNIIALNNMGITNLYMRNHEESLQYFKKAYDIDPTYSATLKNLSNAYDHIGYYDENIKTIEEFKKIKPDDSSLDTNFAMSLLSVGRFKEGWKFYDNRWNETRPDGSQKIMPNFNKPRWNPDLGFEKILIWGEQGIGDQMIHGSMLEDFSKKFKKTYLSIDPKLVKLFSESFPNIMTYSLFDETTTDFFDYHIPLGSIGQYTRHTYLDFFPLKNYYKVSNDRSYSQGKKLKCALSWKSIKGSKSDFKSTSLESLKSILEIRNIDFYSIQYSDSEKEIKDLKDKYNLTIHTIKDLDLFNDIYGLMQFIRSCDFTITTSSTSAHLSGALNIPTYLLLPKAYGKFWYWDNNYEGKNVWYPSIKRFIQEEYKNWTHPIDNLLTFLTDTYDLGIR